ERDRAVVADAELAGAERFPADQTVEIIGERADVGARLAQPERRLDERPYPGGRHTLVVIGGARGHVDVRVEDSLDLLPTPEGGGFPWLRRVHAASPAGGWRFTDRPTARSPRPVTASPAARMFFAAFTSALS